MTLCAAVNVELLFRLIVVIEVRRKPDDNVCLLRISVKILVFKLYLRIFLYVPCTNHVYPPGEKESDYLNILSPCIFHVSHIYVSSVSLSEPNVSYCYRVSGEF